MKKQFFSALLCGAVVLSTGTFVSCDNQYEELESRVTVLEGYISELKAQLGKALMTGASITSASQDTKGNWTIVLSNGEKIIINAASGGAGGGSAVTVEQGEGSFTITVDGEAYTIPTGASVNSLVYVPEYVDGKVILGNTGAQVKFLATPAVDVAKATFDIAVAEELKTRASDLMKVESVAAENGYVVVSIKGLGVEAGKSYAVVVSMTSGGTTITSDAFTVEVAADFSFNTEELGGVTVKEEYQSDAEEGFLAMTVKGSALLADNVDLKAFFSELPEGAVFKAASAAKQPVGKAQEKADLLAQSVKADGTFEWASRPGTAFNENADRPGFLINIVQNDVVKGKVYVVINDELAGLGEAFTGGRTGVFEAEWGGREKALGLGPQELDIVKTLCNYEEDITIRHGYSDEWFQKWATYEVVTAAEDVVLSVNDGKLVVGDFAKPYLKGSRGVYWFYRGLMIIVPEALAVDGENGDKYIADDGKQYSGAEGYDFDRWWGQYNEYVNNPEGFVPAECAAWGWTVTESGFIKSPENYTGYGVRLALDAGFEYAYGLYPLHGKGTDQCGMLFINRRMAPEGATMPSRLNQ